MGKNTRAKRIHRAIDERIEAFVQPMADHEVAPMNPPVRATLTTMNARSLLGVAALVGCIIALAVLMKSCQSDPKPILSTPLSTVSIAAEEAYPSATKKSEVQEITETTAEPVQRNTEIVVSVQGLVHRPGLYRVLSGVRVGEALDTAGGVVEKASTYLLNLAEQAVDGMQITVDEQGSFITLPGNANNSFGGDKTDSVGKRQTESSQEVAQDEAGSTVNVNTADASALESLPGIGPATAEAIIAWRESQGNFTSIEQLLEVRGIGPAKFETIKNLVSV